MFKAVDKWLFGYLASLLRRPRGVSGTRHLIFCVCDHFEPFRDDRDPAVARQVVRHWLATYPGTVDSFRDADGVHPKHTFFYPQEDYDADILDQLAQFCRRGYGEVEIHLHHRHDTQEGLREKLVTFRDLLHKRHGLLGVEQETLDPRPQTSDPGEDKNVEQKHAKDAKEEKWFSAGGGEKNSSSRTSVQNSSDLLSDVCGLKPKVFSPPRYGFIHGNWALCNSRPDGDWCGVNEELGLLKETGCYADFTFPSAPSPTQPRLVNAIYYARDTPGKPRGADSGGRARSQKSGNSILNPEPRTHSSSLLLLTGPLALNWKRRKWGVLPRLENAEISGANPPTEDRIRLWAQSQIGVEGRPDWVFVKVHTHGCVAANARVLLGTAMQQAHTTLQKEFNDGTAWQLHYATARELFNMVKAAEANLPGSPGQYRDRPIIWEP